MLVSRYRHPAEPSLSRWFSSPQVFSQLQSVVGGASVSVHLVEVSPVLSRFQAETLTGNRSEEASSEDDLVYRSGETDGGVSVSWYRRLEDVPAGIRSRRPGRVGSELLCSVKQSTDPRRFSLQLSASLLLTSSLTLCQSTSSR